MLYYPIPDYDNYMISQKGRILSLNYGGRSQKYSRPMKGLSPMKLLSNSGFACGQGNIILSKDGKPVVHKIEDLLKYVPSK